MLPVTKVRRVPSKTAPLAPVWKRHADLAAVLYLVILSQDLKLSFLFIPPSIPFLHRLGTTLAPWPTDPLRSVSLPRTWQWTFSGQGPRQTTS